MAKESSADRRKKIDELVIAFLMMTAVFLTFVMFKTHIGQDISSEVNILRERIQDLKISP